MTANMFRLMINIFNGDLEKNWKRVSIQVFKNKSQKGPVTYVEELG